jgi:hypothetical protein
MGGRGSYAERVKATRRDKRIHQEEQKKIKKEEKKEEKKVEPNEPIITTGRTTTKIGNSLDIQETIGGKPYKYKIEKSEYTRKWKLIEYDESGEVTDITAFNTKTRATEQVNIILNNKIAIENRKLHVARTISDERLREIQARREKIRELEQKLKDHRDNKIVLSHKEYLSINGQLETIARNRRYSNLKDGFLDDDVIGNQYLESRLAKLRT